MLIKILGVPEDIIALNKPIVINNSALKEVFVDLIEITGEPWTKVKDFIK